MYQNRNHRNFKTIYDAIPVGMMIIDEHGFIKRSNAIVTKLVQHDYSEIINKRPGQGLECINIQEMKHKCGYSPFCSICPIHKIFKEVMDSWQSVRGVEIQAALLVDGKEFNPWMEINAEPALINKKRFVVLSIQDVTKRKNAERELERISKLFKNIIEHADKITNEATVADLTKSDFLVNISHEIRTYMNAIIGFSQILEKENLTNEQKHHIGIMRESAMHLLELINDLLDFSNIESGRMNVNIIDCSLEHTFAVLESLMRPQAQAKGLEFQIIQCEQLPAQIRTDPVRLRQCLVNLINNAIKFTNNGHVYVYVSLKNINNKDSICFDIEDTGIGIPIEKQQLIFEIFHQIDDNCINKDNSTGLGLPITKKLAQLLNGELSLRSEVEKGSVFSLTIPANINVNSQPLFNKYERFIELYLMSGFSQKEKISKKVLVADSNRSNQVIIKYLLETLGFEVTIAENGKEAMDKALKKQYDLIFMDVQIPGTNGLDIIKVLRTKGLKTTIVALTSNAILDNCQKYISAGYHDCLSKPVNKELLLSVIKKYLPLKRGFNIREDNSVKSEVA